MTKNTPSSSLAGKAAEGGAWLAGIQVVRVLSGLAPVVVYAHFLGPEAFGLVAVAMILLGFIEAFTQPGIDLALIQNREADANLLDAGWTLQLVRGLMLYGILFITAPAAAAYFEQPQLVLIIRVLALSLVLVGCSNIASILFRKQLDFRKQFFFEAIPVVTGAMVGVIVAILYRSVWALIAANLGLFLTQLILSYLMHPRIPRWFWSPEHFKRFIHFGVWTFFGGILFFFSSRADNFVATKMLGLTAVGYYAFAFNLVDRLIIKTGKVVSGLSFPLFARIQDDTPRVRAGFLRLFEFSNGGLIYISLMLAVFAPHLVHLVFSEKWIPIIPSLQILAVAAGVQGLRSTDVFMALGRPRFNVMVLLVRVVVMGACIYPLTLHFALVGVAYSVLAGNVAAALLWFGLTGRLLELSPIRLIGIYLPCVVPAVILGVLFDYSSGDSYRWISFVGLALLVSIAYLGSILGLSKLFRTPLYPQFVEFVQGLRATRRS